DSTPPRAPAYPRSSRRGAGGDRAGAPPRSAPTRIPAGSGRTCARAGPRRRPTAESGTPPSARASSWPLHRVQPNPAVPFPRPPPQFDEGRRSENGVRILEPGQGHRGRFVDHVRDAGLAQPTEVVVLSAN